MPAQLDRDYVRTRPTKAYTRLVSHLLFQGRFATTPHRWLNRPLIALMRMAQHAPSLRPVAQPLFIIGMGRSGSTILGKVLSMHPELGFLNEPKALWYSLDPREDVHGHFGGGGRFRLDEREVTPELRARARRLFATYLLLSGADRLLDKNPEHVFRIPYVRAIFPDAHFLLLVRNGWDTLDSISRWSAANRLHREGRVEDWWGIDRAKWHRIVEELVPEEPLLRDHVAAIRGLENEAEMAAVEWIVTMEEGRRALERWPAAITTVRYEALTADPRTTLTALGARVGLGADPAFLSYAERTLEPNPARPTTPLAPWLEEPFERVMARLGYPTRLST